MGPPEKVKLTERQITILNLVDEEGFVSIENMVTRFRLTPQTIRRDINLLCQMDMLQRYHGGASRVRSHENTPYRERLGYEAEAKQKIARMVAEAIPNSSSLYLNIGTTTEAVAMALGQKENLHIVTNNINVANILRKNESFEIMVAGGAVRKSDGGIVGAATTDFVNQFSLDIGIIGISGIAEDGSLLDFDYHEVQTARAIIQNSKTVYLVTDSSKFGRRAMIRLGQLSDIDHLFTDKPAPASFMNAIESSGVAMHIVDLT